MLAMSSVVLITGMSSGIGKVTAEYFQARGWKVLGTSRTANVSPKNDQAIYSLDVTNAVQCHQVVDRILQEHGHIDVLVNNAGYGLFGAFEQCSVADVEKQYQVNVFGTMNVCRAVLPAMRQRRAGTIVNISSMGGKFVVPYYGIYNSTKFAVEGFSEGLWHEVKPFGIRVKVIEPGAIDTGFYDRSKQEGAHMNITDDYRTVSNRLWNNYAQAGKTGHSAAVVAKIIYRAAVSRTGRLRYVTPWQTKLVVWLNKVLPHQLGLWLVAKSTTDR